MKELNDSDEMLTQPGVIPRPSPMTDELYDMIFPQTGPVGESTGDDSDILLPGGVKIREDNEDE